MKSTTSTATTLTTVTIIIATLFVGQVVSKSVTGNAAGSVTTDDARGSSVRDAADDVTRDAKANITRMMKPICGRVSIEFFQPQQVHLALAGEPRNLSEADNYDN